MLPRSFAFGSALLGSFLFIPRAHAQNVDGTFRLSAGGPVFSTETQTQSGDVTGDVKMTDVGGDRARAVRDVDQDARRHPAEPAGVPGAAGTQRSVGMRIHRSG